MWISEIALIYILMFTFKKSQSKDSNNYVRYPRSTQIYFYYFA